ncbi:MAG: ParA family protein, partial [Chloroflexi bacterium]|nr:ParA family protein [Chloroflexota bacterium]
MHVVTVASLKGGVGKTTTAHTLGTLLAANRRVLLVDMDPQASLTRMCGVRDVAGRSMAEVLGLTSGGVALRDIIRPLGHSLAIAPAHSALVGTEIALALRAGRETLLKNALDTVASHRRWPRLLARQRNSSYDVALVDTPPSLGLLTVNALVAADGILIPIVPETIAWESLRLLMDKIDQVRRAFNPRLKIIGVLPTFYDSRLLHHRAVVEGMRATGLPVLDVTVGRSIRVAEAAEHGQTVVSYDPANKRSAEYWVLARVVEGWLEDRE